MSEYRINTQVFADGKITQQSELVDDHLPSLRDIARRVIDTQDQQIREALIKLGWTPPGESHIGITEAKVKAAEQRLADMLALEK